MLVKIYCSLAKNETETQEIKILEHRLEDYTLCFDYLSPSDFRIKNPHKEKGFTSNKPVYFLLQFYDDSEGFMDCWKSFTLSTNELITLIAGEAYLNKLTEKDREEFLFCANYYITMLIRELKVDYLDLTSTEFLTDDMRKEVLKMFENRTEEFLNDVVYCI